MQPPMLPRTRGLHYVDESPKVFRQFGLSATGNSDYKPRSIGFLFTLSGDPMQNISTVGIALALSVGTPLTANPPPGRPAANPPPARPAPYNPPPVTRVPLRATKPAVDYSAGSLRERQQAVLKRFGGDRRRVPLNVKAEFYQWAIERYHISPWHQMHPRVILSDEPDVPPNYYYNEDQSTWNGALLAALSYKYAVTKDKNTLKLICRLLDGLHIFQEVTGKPGLASRCVLRRDTPFDKANRRYVSPDRTVYHFRSDAAKGTYNQLVAGYATLLMLAAPDLPAGYRERAFNDMHALVLHLIDNDYRIVDQNGKPTSYGDLRPLFGIQGVPFNAQVAYMIVAAGTYLPPRDAAKFARIRRQFKRLKTKHHVYYENPSINVLLPQQVVSMPFIKGMNDRNHAMNAAYVGLLLEIDSARKMGRKLDAELLYQLGRTMYFGMQTLQTHHNALCNFMWAGILSDPVVFRLVVPMDRPRVQKQIDFVLSTGIEQLRRFPIDRFHYPGRKVATRTPQFVDVRKRHNSYHWKGGPFDRWEVTGPPTNTHTASIDFLYAYWLMRYWNLDKAVRLR